MQKIKEYIIDRPVLYNFFVRIKLLFDSFFQAISKKEIAEYLVTKQPLILEIGANVGSDTVEMAVLWPQGKIYAFEPVPDVVERLKFKTKNFKNVEIVQSAVSDKSEAEATEMFISDNSSCSSSLLKPKDHLIYYPTVHFDKKITVSTVFLPTWLEKNNLKMIDLLWIDVQGAELNIFRSLADEIKNIHYIYTEVSLKEFYEGGASFGSLKEYLGKFGFYIVKTDLVGNQLMGNVLFGQKNWVQ
ncbi:MAG: FkbM family methyltransferase [Patescibacteria group bacterium]